MTTDELPDLVHEHLERTVAILDTVTGEVREHRMECPDDHGPYAITSWKTSAWDWWQGNLSCDCNRRDWFFEEVEIEGEQENLCIRALRFLVVGMDPMPEGFTLDEFNKDYPPEVQQIGMQCRAVRESST